MYISMKQVIPLPWNITYLRIYWTHWKEDKKDTRELIFYRGLINCILHEWENRNFKTLLHNPIPSRNFLDWIQYKLKNDGYPASLEMLIIRKIIYLKNVYLPFLNLQAKSFPFIRSKYPVILTLRMLLFSLNLFTENCLSEYPS